MVDALTSRGLGRPWGARGESGGDQVSGRTTGRPRRGWQGAARVVVPVAAVVVRGRRLRCAC